MSIVYNKYKFISLNNQISINKLDKWKMNYLIYLKGK